MLAEHLEERSNSTLILCDDSVEITYHQYYFKRNTRTKSGSLSRVLTRALAPTTALVENSLRLCGNIVTIAVDVVVLE
jgi:hypothetical protein